MTELSLFIDFDNTIADDDVGNRFFTYFSQGRSEPIVRRWLAGEIPARTSLSEEAALVKGTPDQFAAFVDKFSIDPGLAELVEYCRAQAIPVRVLSDGLDFYVRRILDRHGFHDLETFANQAVFGEGGLQIAFPYWTARCPSCGNCKGERIRVLKRPSDAVVYVGDGFSDLCAVTEADVIFAKDDLAEHLKAQAIRFYEFARLADIVPVLKRLASAPAARPAVGLGSGVRQK